MMPDVITVRTYYQNMTIVVRMHAERNTSGSLSERVEIRLKSLSRAKLFATM